MPRLGLARTAYGQGALKHPATGTIGLQLYSLRHLFENGDVAGTLAALLGAPAGVHSQGHLLSDWLDVSPDVRARLALHDAMLAIAGPVENIGSCVGGNAAEDAATVFDIEVARHVFRMGFGHAGILARQRTGSNRALNR